MRTEWMIYRRAARPRRPARPAPDRATTLLAAAVGTVVALVLALVAAEVAL